MKAMQGKGKTFIAILSLTANPMNQLGKNAAWYDLNGAPEKAEESSDKMLTLEEKSVLGKRKTISKKNQFQTFGRRKLFRPA